MLYSLYSAMNHLHKDYAVSVLTVIFLNALTTASPSTLPSKPETNFISEGTNRLVISILKSYIQNKSNLVFSPLGYSVILSILAEGSRGNTKDQLISVLSLPQETKVLRNNYKTLLSRMQERDVLNKPEFRNWFYIYENCSVEEVYKKILEENYLTEVREIQTETSLSSDITFNSSTESVEASLRPLSEVEVKAQALEKELTGALKSQVEKDILTALSANRLSSPSEKESSSESKETESRIIVFNALYFRGKWASPFNLLEDKCQFEGTSSPKNPPCLESEGEFEFVKLPKFKASAVELPYQGDRYSLLIILPESDQTVDNLIRSLDEIKLEDLTKQMTKRTVRVRIPKFQYHTITRPKEALMKEGITDIFSDQADLSGITGKIGLYLDDLVQLVTLEVDEGSAAFNWLAASSIANLRSPGNDFIASRPFLYFLRDRIDNVIVVAGKLEDPTLPES